MRDADLLICGNGDAYTPLLLDEAKWTSQMRGSPSKFEFEILKDKNFTVAEGQRVTFKWKNNKIFCGYIFKYSYNNSDDTISITAYDQLRYLKNKDTYVFENKTLSQIANAICRDFKIETGAILSSGYAIPNYPCDNMTLFDIIEGAIDETLKNTKKLYIMYDDYGHLTIVPFDQMKVQDFTITGYNASDFDFSSSIDDKTYNKIKLYFNNDKTGVRDIYIEQDSDSQGKWGILQLYEEVKKGENGKTKAQTLLKLYNAPTRTLTVSGIDGNCKVRAGSMVLVKIDLGNNLSLSNYMLVENCTHTFNDNEHKMDLALRGGKLNG